MGKWLINTKIVKTADRLCWEVGRFSRRQCQRLSRPLISWPFQSIHYATFLAQKVNN